MPVLLLLERTVYDVVDSAWRTVDVEAKLLKVAREALTVIQREGLNSMQNMLSGIKQFFSDIASEQIGPSDWHLIEIRSANCFKYIDKLHETRLQILSPETKADVRQLRIHTADILVMSCSQFVDQDVRAATSTVTTKINEIRHGSSFSAESPTEVRFVTAYLARRAKIGRDKTDLCR